MIQFKLQCLTSRLLHAGAALALGAGLIGTAAQAQTAGGAVGVPRLVDESRLPANFAYRAFETTDALGRSVRFYLTDAESSDDRPLVLALQNTGCASLFQQVDGRVAGGWFTGLRGASRPTAQTLIVEKPGVRLFDLNPQPGTSTACAAGFVTEHSMDRWLAAVEAATRAALGTRAKPPKALLAVGHGEGAQMAAQLAGRLPGLTHVALISGGPSGALEEWMALAAAAPAGNSKAGVNPQLRALAQAAGQVRSEPRSTDKTLLGQPYRYWAARLSASQMDALAAKPLRVFIAHGERDRSVPVSTSDRLAAELLARGADLTWVRIPGADHALNAPGVSGGAALRDMLGTVLAWQAGTAPNGESVVWPIPTGVEVFDMGKFTVERLQADAEAERLRRLNNPNAPGPGNF
jgi:pimeloyl-ACP methyl ester carboxylesterase